MPVDVSVVGFDDVRLPSYVSPALTTIHQPADRIGERAAALLVDVVRGRRRAQRVGHVLLPPTLVVRASTAPSA